MTRRAVDRNRRPNRRKLRLFCALHPTAEEASLLLDFLPNLESLPPHQPTASDQLHMTVLFIGDIAQQDLDEVKKSVERAAIAVQPVQWQPDRIDTLPERGPARTITAMGSASGVLTELNRRLSQRLSRHNSRRDFLPHITLARLKPPKSGFNIDFPITVPPISFSTVQLMDSRLLPSGAEHQTVLEVPLGG